MAQYRVGSSASLPGFGSTFAWRDLLVADADQAIGSPQDPNGCIQSASETGGLWTATLNNVAAAFDGGREVGRWMFPMPTGFVFDGNTGIAFRILRSSWPDSGSRLAAVCGVIDRAGTDDANSDALGIANEDNSATQDTIGGLGSTNWSGTQNILNERATSVWGEWTPLGDGDVAAAGNGQGLGMVNVRAFVSGTGTMDHLIGRSAAVNVQTTLADMRMMVGFGSRAAIAGNPSATVRFQYATFTFGDGFPTGY